MSAAPILKVPPKFVVKIDRKNSNAQVRAEIQISKPGEKKWEPIKVIKLRNYALGTEVDDFDLESGNSYLAELWLICEETPLGGAYNFAITYNDQSVIDMKGDVDTTPGKLDVITNEKPYLTLLQVQ